MKMFTDEQVQTIVRAMQTATIQSIMEQIEPEHRLTAAKLTGILNANIAFVMSKLEIPDQISRIPFNGRN